MVTHRPSSEREVQAIVGGVVAQSFRNRGIGSELVEWSLTRATEKLRSAQAGLPRVIRAFAYDWQRELLLFFAKHEHTPARYYDEMLLPLDQPVAVAPRGFEIAAFTMDRSEDARVAANVGFVDHWGSTPMDEPTWKHWLSESTTRLELSYLAVCNDEVIGVLMSAHYPNDQRLHGRREGWIESLSTVREWRNRGVASALIASACNAFLDVGFTHAALGVDTKNPTGAAGLYSRTGFVVDRRQVECRLEVL